MDFDRCEICGEFGRSLMLIGGYRVDLCTEHDRAWGEFIDEQEAHDARAKVQAAMLAAIERGAARQETDALAQEALVISRELYQLGKRWFAETKAAFATEKS